MRPFLHPTLVNGRFGDPAVYVATLFERSAILFDLGTAGLVLDNRRPVSHTVAGSYE
jgi:hypothetical protein